MGPPSKLKSRGQAAYLPWLLPGPQAPPGVGGVGQRQTRQPSLQSAASGMKLKFRAELEPAVPTLRVINTEFVKALHGEQPNCPRKIRQGKGLGPDGNLNVRTIKKTIKRTARQREKG